MAAQEFSAEQIRAQVAQRLVRLAEELERDRVDLAEYAASNPPIDPAEGLKLLLETADATRRLGAALNTKGPNS